MNENVPSAPTLAELAAHPELIDTLAPGVCGGLVVQLASLQQRLGARLAVERDRGDPPMVPEEVVGLQEAARRLGLAAETLRRYRRRPPYAGLRVDNGTRKLLWSGQRIAEYLALHAGKPSIARRRE